MPARPLSTQSLLELLDLFEQSDQSITDADGQRLRGVPGWDLARLQSLRQRERLDWLICNGYSGRFPAPSGDEHVPVELAEDDDPKQYAYRCPETFRKKFVSASEVAVYSVSVPKILGQIATLLETPMAHRRGIESPAIDSVLWNLGKTRIGHFWLLQNMLLIIVRLPHHHRQASIILAITVWGPIAALTASVSPLWF